MVYYFRRDRTHPHWLYQVQVNESLGLWNLDGALFLSNLTPSRFLNITCFPLCVPLLTSLSLRRNPLILLTPPYFLLTLN